VQNFMWLKTAIFISKNHLTISSPLTENTNKSTFA